MRRIIRDTQSTVSVGLGRFSAARMVTLRRCMARLKTGLLLFRTILIMGFGCALNIPQTSVGWSPLELPHDVEGRYQLSFIRNGYILFSLGGKSGGGVVVEVPAT